MNEDATMMYIMKSRVALSLGNFLASGHFFLIIGIVAPYLATFIPASAAGLVISFGALLTLSVFPWIPKLVRVIGSRRLATALALIESLALGLLALNPTPIYAVILVAIACAVSPLIAYQLDLLLEATVKEESSTGRVRTTFLTVGNIVLLIAPLVLGTLLGNGDDYWRVFLVAAASLIPFVVLFSIHHFPEGEPPKPIHLHFTCDCMWQDKDLRATAFGMAMLQFFYHLAPLYIPLYLHNVLGMPWSELGWVFAIMLIPFVIIEYPAGWIADRWLGDKEMMIAGFIIMGTSFAAIATITEHTSIAIVLGILLLTRVGAALTEAMIEGHFFRRVSERDTSTIGIFRMMRPLAALAAPLMASIVLATEGYTIFFIVMGALIVSLGVIAATHIRDVK